MKCLRNLGIKRVVAILLAVSMVWGSTNAFPVYAQEETVTKGETELQSENDVQADNGLVIETWGGYKYHGYEYIVAKYNEDEEITFGINVTSETEDIKYQWYYHHPSNNLDGEYDLIEGATESSYTVKADENAIGSYWCEVIDGTEPKDYDYANGFLHGASFMLRLETDLTITNPKNKVTIKYGEEAILTVDATSKKEDISYQWYCRRDSDYVYKAIDGATESSYTVMGDENTISKYKCIVKDGIETEEAYFDLTVDSLTIANYEKNVTAQYGEDVTFSINATSGTGNISYQWYCYDDEHIEIEGATENSYTIKADENAKYQYYCEVTDGINTEDVYFSLTVDTGLVIDYEEYVSATYGEEVTLTVNATSEVEKEISYQWYYDNDEGYIEIDGANGNSYMVTRNENTKKKYKCKVTNGIETTYAYFYIREDNKVHTEGSSYNYMNSCYGEKNTFTVNATSGSGIITYQWYYQEREHGKYIAITGENTSSYTIRADEDAKFCYMCKVTNGIEEKDEKDEDYVYFYLTVDTGLTIADYEAQVSVKYGEKTTFTVNATSDASTISYQWYYYENYERVAIDGAIEDNYTVTVDGNTKKRYICEVTDGINTEDVNFYLEGAKLTIADYEDEVSAYYGENATFTVNATSGKGCISYQWYVDYYDWDDKRDWVCEAIKGATSKSYTVTVDENTKNQYICKVTDGVTTESIRFYLTKEIKESISYATVDLSANSYNYDGKAKKPEVKSVKLGNQTLKAGTDYTVSYENNINTGTASVVITGIGNYTGTTTKSFTIKAVPISKATATLSTASYNYDGKAKEPEVKSVKLGNQSLKLGTDYTVSYENNTNIGTASVIITGIGNYTGKVTNEFTINAKKGTIFASGSYKYKITSSTEVAFAGLKSKKTTTVTMPKTVKFGGMTFKVTSIADKVLYRNTKVTRVIIGSNVKTIGASAFEGCKKLSKVTIGSNVIKLGNKAFKGCTALKSVTIPSKVTTIGKEAFRSCSKLSSITIKSTKLKKIDKNALKGIKSTAKIKVPAKKLKAYKNLLKNKGQSSKVKIGK